jgi:cellulose biosynthesis protein BcsQ
MTVVALASVKGSPGVTAAALALAGAWRAQRPVVIECDPAGGDLAPYLGLPTTPGLVSLTAAVRRGPDADQVWRHVGTVPGGLGVVVAPVGAEQARVTVRAFGASQLVETLARAADVVAVVDCGRLDPDSVALPVLRQATSVLMCVRPRRTELAHLAPRVPEFVRDLPALGLVLIGPGEFPASEISDTLELPVVAQLPKDPHGAQVLLTAGFGKGSTRLPLARAARSLADRLAASPSYTAVHPHGQGQQIQAAGGGDAPRPLPAGPGAGRR